MKRTQLKCISTTTGGEEGVAARVDGINPRDHENAEIGSKRQVGPIQVIIGNEINHFFMIESARTISGFPLGGRSNKMLVTPTFIIPLAYFSGSSGDCGRIAGIEPSGAGKLGRGPFGGIGIRLIISLENNYSGIFTSGIVEGD